MKKILLLLLALTAYFYYSCGKKEVINPIDTGGTTITTTGTSSTLIQGTITPADAVTSITIYDVNNTPYLVKPDANGIFSIIGLPAGTYFINYYVSLGYVAQPSKTLILTAGQQMDLGKLVFTQAFGIIEGSTAPAGAAIKVTATNTSTKATFSVVPDVLTGNFKFSNLPGGIYTINYTAGASSTAPPDASATVGANQDIILTLAIFKTLGVTGTISGKMDPPVGSIFFYNTASGTGSFGSLDAVSGKFVSPDLLPGNYTVKFGHDFTHKSPPDQSVTLPPGQNIDMGTVKIPLYLYVIPYSVNGTASTIGITTETCSYNAPNLSISASNSGAIDNTLVGLTLALDNVTGPGTYTVQGTSTSYMNYQSGSIFSPTKWGMNNGGIATVVITAIDPVQRIITGTFSATLKPVTNTGADLVITNGVLNLTY